MKSSPASNPNVLLVDDNQDGLLVRKALLEEFGFCVRLASSAEEGLKLFEADHFDVVVTDYRMPGMNGVQLIERLRALNSGVRVILLSGFVDPLGLTEENTAADMVLAKSANEAAHLVRGVKRLVNRTTPRKPAASQRKSISSARAGSR